MIKFTNIRWKNFLSTGNAFIDIPLDKSSTVLFVGDNGAGKSTILDALSFVLFGKAFRKINKSGMINSINSKDCVVEVEFTINSKSYKVVRGIKPNVFEIHCDGVFLNQDSTTKDYQEHLEKFILNMNVKSFTQIVVLGSASFTPFMQLSPADRRSVIEDLLDIQIFSSMNSVVKSKSAANKQAVELNRARIDGSMVSKKFLEGAIIDLTATANKSVEKLKNKKKSLETESLIHEDERTNISQKRDILLKKVVDHDKLVKKVSKMLQLKAKMETNRDHASDTSSFFHSNDTCPTCKQGIGEDIKTKEVGVASTLVDNINASLVEIQSKIDETDNAIKEINKIKKEISTYETTILSLDQTIRGIQREISSIDKELTSGSSVEDAIDKNKKALVDIETEITGLYKTQAELEDERKYIDTAIMLLKDGGIKTKIIKQYLPIVNKTINKYLTQMGFMIKFEINESFEETIKSRYRDDFAYENFSEGEKTRIDLALLFTWRSIAKMKNSVHTNLLILDEIFDGSLDLAGTEDFLKIIQNMTKDTNTIIISHKQDQISDKFSKVFKFEKKNNFSRVTS